MKLLSVPRMDGVGNCESPSVLVGNFFPAFIFPGEKYEKYMFLQAKVNRTLLSFQLSELEMARLIGFET
ncbi:hypothetical protein E2320_014077, partial [Naja naja]